MMVSKVAVIALVSILAVPILLGYGMNFTETTETGYRLADYNGINLTPYLENGTTGSTYSYVHSDLIMMNSQFSSYGGTLDKLPYYNSMTLNNTSFPCFQYASNNITFSSTNVYLTGYAYYYIEFGKPAVTTVSLYETTNGVESLKVTYSNVVSVYVYHDLNTNSSWRLLTKSGTENITNHSGSGTGNYITRMVIDSAGNSMDYYCNLLYKEGYGNNNNYADLSAGYYFKETFDESTPPGLWPRVKLPDYTRQYTVTMNLDSITDPNYALHLELAPYKVYSSTIPYTHLPMEIKKTTTGSGVTWTLTNEMDSSAEVTELFTDPQLSDNTYQFTIKPDCIYDESTQKYYLVVYVTAAYIGSWPSLIGVANPYITYELEYKILDDPNMIFNSPLSEDYLTYYDMSFKADNGARTPTMRIDDALYRAFEYNTITNRTFSPAKYVFGQTNPITTIEIINKIGTSLSFGGHVYAINKGNITINGHSIPANKLELGSILNESGTYDNLINNTKISTTATPSDITLGGSWSASVSVTKMESYTYTKTVWLPGHFAWDGIDQNFLMIGLMTSLGAFIAVGIYMRRTRMSLWPLLLVCGGASLLFLFML